MKSTIVALGGLVITLWALPANAQTCAGGPDLSASRQTRLVGFGAGRADGAQGLGGSFGVGNRRSFASGGATFVNLDGLTGTQTQLSAMGGFNILENGASPFVACPLFGFGYGFGPAVFGESIRSTYTQFGGRIGVRAGGDERFDVVPTFGAAWVGESFGFSFYGDDRFTEYYGVATVGVGLRFNQRRTAVVPSLSIPFGIDSDTVTFTVNLTTGF